MSLVLHNFGCNRNINQALASSVGTENRTDARLLKRLIYYSTVHRLDGSRTSWSSAKRSFIFGRPQVQNPSWSLVVPIEFFFGGSR